jgi:hypothetical protein
VIFPQIEFKSQKFIDAEKAFNEKNVWAPNAGVPVDKNEDME